MILRPIGGLCNRLRALLSWPRPVTIAWSVDADVAWSHFLDVFEPIPGISFAPASGWDVESWSPYPAAPLSWWRSAYRELVPTGPILRHTRALIGTAAYDAIHVRRLDHLSNPGNIRDGVSFDEDRFEYFVRTSHRPIYIAADNFVTQQKYLRLANDRGFVGARVAVESREKAAHDDHRRYTDLHDAVLDLWVCSSAVTFVGSPGSSFSDTINVLRSIQ